MFGYRAQKRDTLVVGNGWEEKNTKEKELDQNRENP